MEFIRLRRNENATTDVRRVTITRNSRGADIAEGPVVIHEGGATFYVSHDASADHFDEVMKAAEDWARRSGIQTIYVQE